MAVAKRTSSFRRKCEPSPRGPVFFWAVVAVLAGAVGGCEVVPTGDAVVTWRFNGQPIHQTDKPCKVFNAGGFGSNQGVVEIAFDGPEPFTDRAACASRVSD